MSDAPVSPEGNGRDARGLFAKGNKLGKGNPALRRLAEMRAAIADAVTVQDLADLMASMLEQARGGDIQAATLLLHYVAGRPRQQEPAVDVPLGELSTAADYAQAFATLAQAVATGSAPADVAGVLAGVLRQGHDATVVADIDRRLAEVEARRA